MHNNQITTSERTRVLASDSTTGEHGTPSYVRHMQRFNITGMYALRECQAGVISSSHGIAHTSSVHAPCVRCVYLILVSYNAMIALMSANRRTRWDREDVTSESERVDWVSE